jgi:hypothetical protein
MQPVCSFGGRRPRQPDERIVGESWRWRRGLGTIGRHRNLNPDQFRLGPFPTCMRASREQSGGITSGLAVTPPQSVG